MPWFWEFLIINFTCIIQHETRTNNENSSFPCDKNGIYLQNYSSAPVKFLISSYENMGNRIQIVHNETRKEFNLIKMLKRKVNEDVSEYTQNIQWDLKNVECELPYLIS